MTDQLTPDQIQQARELALYQVSGGPGYDSTKWTLARAVLALTEQQPTQCDECETTGQNCRAHRNVEQQPEPARHADLAQALWLIGALPMSGTQADKLASGLLSSFDIYRKPEGADHG